jgi:nitrate/nitrite-specific signal transduction histidine kinase
MFDDQIFEDWLDKKTKAIFLNLGEEAINSDEMILLVLKAQTNHFEHLDKDLRTEMSALNKEWREEMILLRQDMDKRFEQVDRLFEQVDKCFEVLTSRIAHFMIWSFATTLFVGGLVIAAIKFLP